jgi:hypothetical protein
MDLVFRHRGKLRQASKFIELSSNESGQGLLLYAPQSDEAFYVSLDPIGNWIVRAVVNMEWAKLRVKYASRIRSKSDSAREHDAPGVSLQPLLQSNRDVSLLHRTPRHTTR